MGPLSAVAVAFFLGLFGGDQAQWWSVRPTILGIIAIVAAAVVLVDTFWISRRS